MSINFDQIASIFRVDERYDLIEYNVKEGLTPCNNLKNFQVRLMFEIYEQIKELNSEIKLLKEDIKEIQENAEKLKTLSKNK